MRKKVELLAPAGNYEAFLGAVNAGADAVYLGGEKFGARAYADNFTTDEICRAIHIAHFMGRKIYLTVNTLVKDAEFPELYDYLRPFYETGLDGVIVQDIGVLCYIREHFKGLPLHASTQMALTGVYGAAFLQAQGVERIVPARELSLDEIRSIKEQTGLEIECFIHGAMCYCYSGQCLFSSILGGRSGNRGRCAQPCRLPYQVYEGTKKLDGVEYPLSLKDLCTVSCIPQLIESGIDSFKIEGRMKKPEYAAGVTALYRKYIDLYEQHGSSGYHVSEEDLEKLRSLYIRSEIQSGYYERHNGREMVTLHNPGYAGSDNVLLGQVKDMYLREPDKQPVKMKVTLKAGEAVKLQVTGSLPQNTVAVCGAVAETAKKSPLQRENIQKQLSKTGNSCVEVLSCEIVMDGDIFLPVSALNELRRKGVEAYERNYIARQGMVSSRKIYMEEKKGYEAAAHRPTKSVKLTESVDRSAIDVFVSAYEQLAEAAMHPCRRIYIDSDLFLLQRPRVLKCMEEHSNLEYFLALPYVLRDRDRAYLEHLRDLSSAVSGFLVRNWEGFAYAIGIEGSYTVVPDAGLYSFNMPSVRFWADYGGEYTLPYELNRKEAGRLVRYADSIGMRSVMVVYGRIPMMVTANCVRKTTERCTVDMAGKSGGSPVQNKYGTGPQADWQPLGGGGGMWLKDRYNTAFPVAVNCQHCYNIIYNSVPCSLHLQEREITRAGVLVRRYDFTTESAAECRQILSGGDFPFREYTTGHLKRGVE